MAQKRHKFERLNESRNYVRGAYEIHTLTWRISMLALQVTSMKHFMNRLLAGDAFDIFLLEEAVISTSNTYTIDGHINIDFFPMEERTSERLPYEFQPWSEIKGLCFNLIKGRHTPLFFKFVFHLKPEKIASLFSHAQSTFDTSLLKALVLTVKYDGSRAVITTGSSCHTFIMDREPDMIWDQAVTGYLSEKGITYENL